MPRSVMSARADAKAKPRRSLFRRARAWLRLCAEAAEERRALRELDERMLKDIGLSREEAARETRRAPWDAPPRR